MVKFPEVEALDQAPSAPAPHRRPVVLVVDDDEGVRSFFRRVLTAQDYIVDVAVDGPSALEAVARTAPDVVLLDVSVPGLDGFEVCRRLKAAAATRLTPVIFVTALSAREHRIAGIQAGGDDFLSKPVDLHQLLARVCSVARVKQYTDDLDPAASIIMTLATMIESRDGYTSGHCHRMANYATSLGRALHLGDADLQALHRGGFLHDIGMLAIPDPVLHRRGPLEPDEIELIKSHTIIGDNLCGNLRSMQAVRPIVRSHHERLDGSGYPDGLQGDQIPVLAQIMGLVDVYEALTSERPYQRPRPIDEAVEVLRSHVTRGWRRRDMVETFAEIARSGSLHSYNTHRATAEGSQ